MKYPAVRALADNTLRAVQELYGIAGEEHDDQVATLAEATLSKLRWLIENNDRNGLQRVFNAAHVTVDGDD